MKLSRTGEKIPQFSPVEHASLVEQINEIEATVAFAGLARQIDAIYASMGAFVRVPAAGEPVLHSPTRPIEIAPPAPS